MTHPHTMRLHGYLHPDTQFTGAAYTEGYVPFLHVFVHRPPSCRYAIVEIIPEEYLVIDLFDTQLANHIFVVGAYQSHSTLNAAIVAGILLYQHP